MEMGKQMIENEERAVRAEDVHIAFYFLNPEYHYFRVYDDDNNMKYQGRIDKTKSTLEDCSCPDEFFSNTKDYKHEHGYSFQCKHLIAARRLRGWN